VEGLVQVGAVGADPGADVGVVAVADRRPDVEEPITSAVAGSRTV
jgi:hypothetical protein